MTSPAAQWQLDRLSTSAREAAEIASLGAGVSLSSWLTKLVSETCSAEGVASPAEPPKILEFTREIRDRVPSTPRIQPAPTPLPANTSLPPLQPPMQSAAPMMQPSAPMVEPAAASFQPTVPQQQAAAPVQPAVFRPTAIPTPVQPAAPMPAPTPLVAPVAAYRPQPLPPNPIQHAPIQQTPMQQAPVHQAPVQQMSMQPPHAAPIAPAPAAPASIAPAAFAPPTFTAPQLFTQPAPVAAPPFMAPPVVAPPVVAPPVVAPVAALPAAAPLAPHPVPTGATMLPIASMVVANLGTRRGDDMPETLLADIATRGVRQPVTVRRSASNPEHYEIICGHRRWRAAQRVGLAQIPAIVVTQDDATAILASLTENLQQGNLSVLDEAQAYLRLLTQHAVDVSAVTTAIGRDRKHIVQSMRLLGLPPLVRHLVGSGMLSREHAFVLLDAPQPEALADAILAEHLSVEAARQRIAAGAKGTP
jgi:ParB family transcriptional regulator, chromosome partitioning protein